ncbi:MAG: glycosyltransferase family A protein [Pseudomonadota bacterium]
MTSENTDPRISVVIPTADRAELVVRAVESVLSDAGPDVEVIAVDDASIDDTLARLRALDDDRLRIIPLEKRSGANIARNTGAGEARAPLLAFLDSDDLFEAGRTARLIELFSTQPDLDAVMDDFTVWTGDRSELAGQPSGVWRGEQLTMLLIAHAAPLTNSALTLRRSVFDAVGGFDVTFKRQQDRDLLLRIARDHAIAFGTGKDVAKHQIVRSMSRNHDGYIAALDKLVGHHQAFLAAELRDLMGYLIARGILKAMVQGDLGAAWREWRALRQADNLPMGLFASLARYQAGRRFRRETTRRAKADQHD